MLPPLQTIARVKMSFVVESVTLDGVLPPLVPWYINVFNYYQLHIIKLDLMKPAPHIKFINFSRLSYLHGIGIRLVVVFNPTLKTNLAAS